jgi:quinol monooxygenase YgiN
MINVIATIRAKSGKEKETELLLRGLLEPTHAEAGCVKYVLHRRKDDSSFFYFVECWGTEQDLQRHLNSAHLQAAMTRRDELLESVDIATVELVRDGASQKGILWNL